MNDIKYLLLLFIIILKLKVSGSIKNKFKAVFLTAFDSQKQLWGDSTTLAISMALSTGKQQLSVALLLFDVVIRL